MLEQLRRNSRSFIIWVLFGIIIAVFIISFGPQAQGELGCGASNRYVLKVDDQEVEETSWRFGMNGLNLGGFSKQQRSAAVMDLLLARELLAMGAESAGFSVSEELVNQRIAAGEVWILGRRADGTQIYFRDNAFDYEILDRWVSRLGLTSMDAFIVQQQRELLAEQMRGLIATSAAVSREEALARYINENTTATADAVVFDPARYRAGLRLTAADVDRYLVNHEDAVKARWSELEATYKGVGAQKRVSEIVFRKERPGAAQPIGDDGQPVETPPDPARERAEKARAQIAAGGDFADIARRDSQDERYAYLGGDLGWRRVDSPGLAHADLTEAVKTLEPGQVSDVIETPTGFHLLKIVDQREGDLTYDQVKHELARDLALEYYARENARRDADEALAKAMAGARLDEQFERAVAPPQMPQRPEGISPEQWEQLMQQIQMQQQNLPQEGSLVIEEGPDVPVEWNGWQGQDAPTASEPAKTEPANNEPVRARRAGAADQAPPAPAAERRPAPAAGALAAPRAATTPAAPATGEALPRPENLTPPNVRTIGPFTRDPDGLIPGIGSSKEIMHAVFEELGEGDLAPQVYEVDDRFVVLQVTDREQAEVSEFEAQEDQLRRRYAREKSAEAVTRWVKDRCVSKVEKGKVYVNREYLSFDDDSGKPQPITYQPCAVF